MEQTGDVSLTEQPSARLRIEHVGPDLPAIWPVLRRQYCRMLLRGAGDTLTEAQIVESLAAGTYRMIVGYLDDRIVGSCIYRFEERERGLACQVVGIAGWNMDVWKDPFCDYMDDVCDRAGAYCLETFARTGTAQQLKERGWRTKAILMEKRYGRQL